MNDAATVEAWSGKDRADENFPVGSWLIGPTLRPHVHAFYAFARNADDIADSATLSPDEKIARLDAMEAVLLGHRDDGAPGPRPAYGGDYYGGFLLDPDGNSVEAVHTDRERRVPDGSIDHLWLRVRDPQTSRRFYETVAPHAGLRLAHDEPDRVGFSGSDFSFSLVRDERPLTEHVHLAFAADEDEDATVQAFHAAALAAGYEDNGGPGERAIYHPGYYGAFVLDPDGHNVELVNHNR